MSIDGADAARRGFRDQVLAAIVLGFEDREWSEVHLEPRDENENDDTMQKTDLRWVFDGTDCADQVKQRTNPINPGTLNRWVEELARTSMSTRRRVIYIGPLATTAHGYASSDPVEFRHLATSSEDLERRALIGLQQALVGNPVATMPRVERVLDDLVTELDAESLGGLRLTRDALDARITAHLRRVVEHDDRNEATNLGVSFRRLLLVHHGGLVHELVRCELTNSGASPWQPAHPLELKWTDSERIRLLHGQAFEHADDRNDWQFQRCSDQCLLELFVAGAIPPGETAAWGLIVRRQGVVRQVSDAWEFSEPLLSTGDAQAAHVDLVVNGHVEWVEYTPAASVSGPRLSWDLHTSGGNVHLSARWRSDPDAPLADETEEGWAAIERACRDVGLPGLPDPLRAP